MDFEQTTPVTRVKTGGKTPADNPFKKAVADIALKVYTPENAPTPAAIGKPIALSFVQTHEDEAAVKTDRNRVRRQTSDAGKFNDPRVTVYVDFADANTEEGSGKSKVTHYASKVTFWTVTRQTRKAKDKSPAAPVSE